MTTAIHEVKTKILEFFQGELGKDPAAVRLLKLSKSEEGWEGTVEVTEENAYLTKIGYPPIFDKNVYSVNLDMDLNVVGYGQGEEE